MYNVLLVDDEVAIRKILKLTVPWEQLGLEVVGDAESATEALAILDELPVDIAFVDINMPTMNGLEFARIAKERYPHLNIIILTASTYFGNAKESIAIGVYDYILKPIVSTEITAVLERLLKRLPGPRREKTPPKEGATTGNENIYEELSPPSKETLTKTKTEEIIAYIQKNHADANLSLTKVAEFFGFNPSYFSRKFKEETSYSFVDYLTRYRMEKAKTHAMEGELMYITAQMVGIPDANYFGRCFKRIVGVKYSEYPNHCVETTIETAET